MRKSCLPLLCLLTNSLFAQQQVKFTEPPIKPARTIAFTTDEGSYMNVDISPDGKTLVFDLLGDLYTVSATGGTATQLTRGVSLNLRPVWSPDGKNIAYISDVSGSFHLNVRDSKGTFHRVLGLSDGELHHGADALWLPGGNYITVNGSIYGLAGGNFSSRGDDKASIKIKINNPVRFSADGRSVYYIDSNKLYRYSYSDDSKMPVSPALGRAQNGNLSPDGRWWAYIADSNSQKCLMVRDLASNTSRMLVPSLIKNDPSHEAGVPSQHYCFSPDSKSIFISYGGKIHRIDVEGEDDRVIPFVANVKSDLGLFAYNTFRVSHDPVKVKYTRSANASPDGKHLVFSTLDKLYVMDLPNGKAHTLVDQSASQFQPVYSPDSKWIAYVSWSDTEGGFLWRVPASGGQPEQLTSVPGQYQRPAWSPDGTLIAVVRGAPKFGDRDDQGRGHLELVPVNGGSVREIDDSVPLWNQLAFSNDGSRIMYAPKRMRMGNSPLSPLLVSNDLEGKDLQIVAVGENEGIFEERMISPDGRYIAYAVDEDVYLIPVCKSTDPQVIFDPRQNLSAIKFAEGMDPHWEQGGKLVSWSYGNHFYRVNPDEIIATAEKTIQKREVAGSPEENYVIATVKPDQVVDLDVTVPSFYGRGLLALKDVRIITMKGNQVIEHGTIVLKDGLIIAIGPVATTAIPAGANQLELPGTTIMPGLVDLHDHMRVPPNVIPQQSWMFLANLAYGVTTARDPSLSYDSYGYAELLRSGQMIGPRLFTVGRAARISDGTIKCDNYDDARAVIHKRAELGGITVKQYMLPVRRQRQWLLMACHEYGLNMTNEGDRDAIMEIAMMKDGSPGVEHCPHWGDVYKDVTSFIVKSGTYLTPTLNIGAYGSRTPLDYLDYKYWHEGNDKMRRFIFSDTSQKGPGSGNGASSVEAILKAHPQKGDDTLHPDVIYPSSILARIRHQGGHITLGSHGNNEGTGAHNELWALQMGGLSNMEALQAATIMGAEALGVQEDLGSLEVGKIADMLILNKNPLDDIHNSREIRYVMKDGVLYNGDTLDEVWPEVKKCPEWKLNIAASEQAK